MGFKKPTSENLNKVVLATPYTWAYTLYYEGKCITPDKHSKELHIYDFIAWWWKKGSVPTRRGSVRGKAKT